MNLGTEAKEATLRFRDGSLILEGPSPPGQFFRYYGGKQRARPIDYPKIITWFRQNGIELIDEVVQAEPLTLCMDSQYEERSYQKEAVDAWNDHNRRGCVVLPTGSGKTVVALRSIREIGQSTLVVLPTIDLMNQWYDLLSTAFRTNVGILGAGYHEIRPLTVTTYDSAYRYVDLYGNRFVFIVFDEVHHLPTEAYSDIAELSVAPYRLGLTATFRRTDGQESKIPALVGPVVYQKSIEDFKGTVLADYDIERINVQLTAGERKLYEGAHKCYVGFVRERRLPMYGDGWRQFIKESVESPDGRDALLAKYEADRIVSHASAKFEMLEFLLKLHVNDRVLIFTKDVDLTYAIAHRYLIPPITHHTDTKERKDILDKFRSGQYRFLVSSEVLNEGVDVPAANVAIILGGTASPVRHVQRLGRILRKKGDQRAILYEVIASATSEPGVSRRRRNHIGDAEKKPRV